MEHTPEKVEQDILQELLLKGDEIQKLSVIQALPELLETDHNAAIARILPKIQQELPNSSTEFHIATSNLFKLLFEMDLPINLLHPVLQGIDNRDPIIATAWTDTLLTVIPTLSHAKVMNEVLPFSLKMTHLTKNIFYRVASCKILGQIAIHPKVSHFDVKKDILPTAQSLCQDCLYEIRAAMCAELPNIAQGLASDSVVKSSLLPCLVELSSDENMLVRATAVDSVVHLIKYLSGNTVSNTIIPLVKKLCDDSCREGDHTFTAVAKYYGTLLENIQSELTTEDSIWFFNFYTQLAKNGLTFGRDDLDIETSLALMCREYCAYNLPAVTSFVLNSLPRALDAWICTFTDLAGDPCYLVRKAVSSCVQEIAQILGKNIRILVPDFVKLLRDDNEEVLDALVPNISATLDILTSSGLLSVENSSQATIEIARALLKCQVEIFKCHNWRRKKKFLEQIECLSNCMPGEFIHQHFTQVIMSLSLEARAKPVRTQATKTVLFYLRASPKENHRKWIRDWMLNNLLLSKSCYTRQIYINMCIEAMKIFSLKYFKEFFFLPLLTLADDPIAVVRLCVVKLVPVLKQMLIIPVDRNLQIKLENVMAKIESTEKDKDVLYMLKCKFKEAKEIPAMNTEQLLNEKRKIDEEDKIIQGKSARGYVNLSRSRGMSMGSTTRSIKPMIRQNSVATLRPTTSLNKMYISNEMSFLGQHFYTDAGVVLPEKQENNSEQVESIITLEEDLAKLKLSINVIPNCQVDEEKISTISSENIDIESLSSEDLKELETSTTNITDDVKVNLQKITKSKSMNKISMETVRKRSKRYSCILPSESHLPIRNNLKRRSLGIHPGEVSRIPVSFKPKKLEESSRLEKTCSIPTVSSKIDVDDHHASRLKYPSNRNSSLEPLNTKENVIKTNDIENNQIRKNECIHNNEVKENIPMNSIRTNVPNKIKTGKASGLPVLSKRARPDSAK